MADIITSEIEIQPGVLSSGLSVAPERTVTTPFGPTLRPDDTAPDWISISLVMMSAMMDSSFPPDEADGCSAFSVGGGRKANDSFEQNITHAHKDVKHYFRKQ